MSNDIKLSHFAILSLACALIGGAIGGHSGNSLFGVFTFSVIYMFGISALKKISNQRKKRD